MLGAVVTGTTVTGHSHVVRRGRSGTVRGADARVVLRSTPAQANTGVANRITLHLVDSHLSSVSVDELNETATLARGDLDVGDFTKALEERAQLVLGNVTGKTTDKDGRVVGVGELVHLRGRVEAAVRETLLHTAAASTTVPHLLLGHAAHHRATVGGTLTEAVVATVINMYQ